ncbi:hypothetical protein [Cohnella sp. WQ 127256]|uniref:hypothetical protein n=1 Tax=Cohnella sp. WQ 127256 TaxID=2938790 RepID=UPI002118637E|nr:hypothetical protein [Cohnella sp. WQ 127256]
MKSSSNDSGSITLEASMVFPWVVMMTFLLLFFSLFISQGALLYYSTSVLAERTAFSWSNSAKDAHTGAYPQGQYDGLYWRLIDDSLVQGLFGLASSDSGTGISVEINSSMTRIEGSSAVDKLKRSSFELSSSQPIGTGDINYLNIGIKREIGVHLTSIWLAEPLLWLRGGGAAEADVSALVVEPQEFLRTFDLIRYYAAKMKNSPEGATAYRDKAGGVLQKRKQ